MSFLVVITLLSLSGVLGKSSVGLQKSGNADVISQNLTAVWEAIHELEHRVHHLQAHPQQQRHGHGQQLYGGRGDPDHPHHGGDGHGHGHHGGFGKHKESDHHELMSLVHEVGIRHMPSNYYISPVMNSTTQVTPAGGGAARPAFGAAYILYLKGHFTGGRFNKYADDIICIYNAGGSIAFHLIHPDGSHYRKVLGDVKHDHHAQYVVVIPGGVWEASELIEGDYALMTFVAAPALDYSRFAKYDLEALVTEFPQYEDMIRRLDTIAANDVPLNISQSSHDHKGHQGHDHHDQHHDEHHNDHGPQHMGHHNHHGSGHGGHMGHQDDHHMDHQSHNVTGHGHGHHDDSHEVDDSHEHDHP